MKQELFCHENKTDMWNLEALYWNLEEVSRMKPDPPKFYRTPICQPHDSEQSC